MENIVIVGTSTTADNIYHFVKKYSLFNILGFAVNSAYKEVEYFKGKPVFEIERLESVIDKQRDYLFIAIQWNNLNADRRDVYIELKNKGYKFANIVSPYAIVHGSLLGDNCWISDFACIEPNAKVYNNVFVKSCALIGDHSIVDDHCFIGAKSTIGGGARIGKQSFIGLGAIVFDEVQIGIICIVGAATSIKRNLPDFSVYKTSSSFFVTKIYSEEVIESKLQFRKNIR